MTSGFQNLFTGNPVKPAQVQCETLTFATSLTLVWPTETIEGVNYVAGWMDCTASGAGLSITMPSALQGSNGVAGIFSNVGAQTFTVLNSVGTLIGTVAAGEVWILVLTDNSTASGTWEFVQLGATTSNAQAAALAGYGLEAILTQLQLSFGTVYASAGQAVGAAYRAKGIVWTGATGTLQLGAISTLTAGWWSMVTNRGTDAVTVSTTGSDTINGAASISIPANPGGLPYSVLIVASSTGFNTFAGAPSLIPITGGGTGADNAADALTNLGASTLGANIFSAPNAAAVLGLLGIGKSAFTEATVSTNQALTSSAANTAFVCTSPITISLPDSTTLDNEFIIAVFSQGGAVTLSPVGSDKINDAAAGATYVVPQNASVMIVTDGAGSWWLFFLNYPGVAWTTAGGTADAITAAFTPPHVALTNGLIVGVRATAANATTTPSLNVDGTVSYPIVKNSAMALAVNDIAGAGFEGLYRLDLTNTRWELLNPATPWLDNFGSTQGEILFRGASTYQALAPGTVNQILRTGGAAADLSWSDEAPGTQTSISAASTTDLGSISSHNALITGAASINSLGNTALATAPIYLIEFSGASTLINSASIINPGAVDILAGAGDTAVAEYLGGGAWRIRNFTTAASGYPGGMQGLGIAKQGLLFSATGGSYALIKSFGGVSAVRTGAGNFTVTLGSVALPMGFFHGQATNPASGDSIGFAQPNVTLVAGNSYTFVTGYASSKAAVDPDLCLILFY